MLFSRVPIAAKREVLAFQGSPREGNTRAALEAVLTGLELPARIIDLGSSSVLPIADCALCKRSGACTQKDDFPEVYARMLAAPMLILGTPLYWYTVSAQLKAFVDRWSCGLSTDAPRFEETMRGKWVALVSPQADEDLAVGKQQIESVRLTCAFLEMRFAGALQLVAQSRTEVYNSPQAQAEARSFGRRLRALVSSPSA